MELNLEIQKDLLNLINKNQNIFISGPAGTGKSSIIKRLFLNLKNKNKIFISLIQQEPFLKKLGFKTKKLKVKKTYKKIWKNLEFLFIDEINRLSIKNFEFLDQKFSKFKNSKKSFGNLQLIFSGDFLQQNSVCFISKSWKNAKFKCIYLNKIIRQLNPMFQNFLSEIRLGKISLKTKAFLTKLTFKKPEKTREYETQQSWGTSFASKAHVDKKFSSIIITKTNAEAQKINSKKIQKFINSKKDFIRFYMSSKNKKVKLKNKIVKSTIDLCIGIQVILLKNQYQVPKGTLGIILNFNSDGFPIVKFLNNVIIKLTWYGFEQEELDKEWLSYQRPYEAWRPASLVSSLIFKKETKQFWQIPVRIAFSLPIETFNNPLNYAFLNFSHLQSCEDIYSVLSKIKSLKNLYIENLDFDKIIANPNAIKFYKDILTFEKLKK